MIFNNASKYNLYRIAILLFSTISIFCDASEPNLNIRGQITNLQNAPVIIYLVDEETSKKPFEGIEKLIIEPDKNSIEQNYIDFIFRNISEGVYGIRCYQDLNNNAKLDKGLMGPVEPWGLSWNNAAILSIPTFDNFNFELSSNDKYIIIELQ